MDTLNIITLVAVIIVLACVVFQFVLIGQLSKKNEDLSSMINKLIMTNEEYKAHLGDLIDQKGRDAVRAINEANQDTKLQLGYHKSFLEENAKKNEQNIVDIKDRLEYLSTEVNID
jgi:predicted nuclease with TOPRIM domain